MSKKPEYKLVINRETGLVSLYNGDKKIPYNTLSHNIIDKETKTAKASWDGNDPMIMPYEEVGTANFDKQSGFAKEFKDMNANKMVSPNPVKVTKLSDFDTE